MGGEKEMFSMFIDILAVRSKVEEESDVREVEIIPKVGEELV